MNTQKYGKYVIDKIQNWSAGEPVTTAVVADDLACFFGMDIENAKKITNVNMKRLADKGKLIRVKKGVYGKVKETSFGRLIPNADEMITSFFLREGNNAIGYITGPTLLNAIGLCSLIPKERHIATNHYRRQIPDGAKIRVHKPVATVNNENVRYFQAIEMFTAMEQYPIDTENPDIILRGLLQKNNIDNERLILYARKHCGQKALLKTIDVALGEIEI
jgi:predicted transcriptional regulator of viral defense system